MSADVKVKRVRHNATNVKVEQFVEVVMRVNRAGGKIADIAKELNLEVGSVNARLWSLRKKGVNLPNFTRGGGGGGGGAKLTDEAIAKLNEIIAR